MIAALALSFAAAGGAATHPALHPAGVDLYVEIDDVPALMRAYANAPAARFIADGDVQKLGALTKLVGIEELGTLVRSTLPRLSGDKTASGLFDAGDLVTVTASLSGFDRETGQPEDATERVSVLIACDFASAEGAERIVPALEAAQWLAAPRTITQSDAEAHTNAGENASAASPLETIDLGAGPLAVQRHTLNIAGSELAAWSVRSGTRWILGAGRSSPADVVARAAGKQTTLAAHALLFTAEKSFTPASGTVVARVLSDMRALPFVAAGEETSTTAALVATLLPFAGTRGTWRIELRGDRFVTEGAYTRIGAPTALDALVSAAPVEPGSVAFVPPNAVGAWAVQIAPARLPDLLASWLAPSANAQTIAPERRAELAKQLERTLGANAAFSLLPFASVQSFTPQVLVTLELRDHDGFLAALRELTTQLQEQRPDVTFEDRPYHKLPIRVFSAPAAPRTPAPATAAIPLLGALSASEDVTPAIAVLADRVLIALKATQLRTEIQRLEKLEEQGAPPPTHALAATERFPAGAIEASSIDWAGLFGKLYDLARGFAPMLAQGQPLPFDPATLPAASSFTKFFQPSFAWTKPTESGLYTRSESSFGPETPLTLVALFTGLSRTQGSLSMGLLGGAAGGARGPARGTETTPGASGAKPAPKSAQTGAVRDPERDKTLKVLSATKLGIAVFRSQTGHAPDTLARLLEATESFPKGFLDPAELPRDAWGRELRYVVAAEGVKYRLWSLGPDGVDQDGSGDDVPLP